ncbi:MAG: hypothetical protein M3083_02570 [Actinomycetota bacterium]|nr:hypothetical protein [Actinomycetota bacterium]MDQ6946037.1 hypothetical protein [Actinomycetota bacterium]
MPDPIKLLNEELNQLARLFKQEGRMGGQLEQAAETEAEAICDLVSIHTTLEEEVVYPALRTIDAEMVESACSYGEKTKRLIKAARNCRGSGSPRAVVAVMKQLQGAVASHSRWEEDVLAPKLHELSINDYDQLGHDMYSRTQELLHQYPRAGGATVLTEGYSGSPKL